MNRIQPIRGQESLKSVTKSAPICHLFGSLSSEIRYTSLQFQASLYLYE